LHEVFDNAIDNAVRSWNLAGWLAAGRVCIAEKGALYVYGLKEKTR
jgi:hypothetical protein